MAALRVPVQGKHEHQSIGILPKGIPNTTNAPAQIIKSVEGGSK
jgi:hypothetical protein